MPPGARYELGTEIVYACNKRGLYLSLRGECGPWFLSCQTLRAHWPVSISFDLKNTGGAQPSDCAPVEVGDRRPLLRIGEIHHPGLRSAPPTTSARGLLAKNIEGGRIVLKRFIVNFIGAPSLLCKPQLHRPYPVQHHFQ